MNLTLRSIAVAAALAATGLSAQTNLIQNPSFETGLASWGAFGNAFGEPANPPAVTPRTGNGVVKMFGNFTNGFDVSGVFQSFAASPGQTYTLDCWSRQFSGDPMIGAGAPNDNWMVMKIAFFDAANAEIAGFEQTILDATFPQDVWIDNPAVSGTAPAGTASVQALILYLQPLNDGGAGLVDDVEFFGPPAVLTYPGSGEDVSLATGIGGTPVTTGAGNDVKPATGGQLIEIEVSSPQGGFNMMPYWVFAQAFNTGSTPIPQIPGLYFNLRGPLFALVGSTGSPLGDPVIAPSGSSTYLVAPGGLAGTSVILQALVVTPGAANGLFAISDGHEIVLQ